MEKIQLSEKRSIGRNELPFIIAEIGNNHNGDLELVAENPGNISSWMTDNDGKLRIATTSDGVNTSLLYRKDEADEFQTILTTNFKERVAPLFFTFDNKELYVSSNRNRDKSAIYKLYVTTYCLKHY